MTDYKELTKNISSNLVEYNKNSPELMKAFRAMSGAATKTNALDEKTKELIALAIGISTKCNGCIGFHTQKLVKLGVSKEEFTEMLDVAVYMGGGPSLMYAAEAMEAFNQFS